MEKFAIDLSIQLIARGHLSEIVCLKDSGDMLGLALAHDLKVRAFNKRDGRDLKLLTSLAEYIRKEKFDIVHTHNMAPLIYGTLASRLALNSHLIHTRHGREPEVANALIWALNKKVVTISHDAKERLHACNRIPDDKVCVIQNGVDLGAFGKKLCEEEKLELKRSLGLADGAFIVGNIGRLAPEKDQESLITAFSKFLATGANAELVIAGDGPLMARLTEQASFHGIKDRVKLLGYRSDISRLLNIFDVFVLSSSTEGISLTLLEAMAAGKPIIATRVGGNPEVVEDEKTGLLVPSGAPDDLAAALQKLYADRYLLEKYGQAGERRAHDVFDIAAMTDAYIKLYHEI